jgi:hypothetical protein
MTRQFSFALVAGALALPTPAVVNAQQTTTPRVGVCFYEDADYRGNYFCAAPGEQRASVRSMNDRISSIRVFGGAEVEVFADNDFNGNARRITRNVPNLGNQGLNDQISSFRVRDVRSGSARPYNNGQYGYGSSNPDRIVRRAYQDLLNREPDAEGMRVYRSKIVNEGWTETQVRDALRDSREYREATGEPVTRARAQEIVRRAYLNVLQREPDPAAAPWVERVINENWTQQDLERELRKSDEYRRKR